MEAPSHCRFQLGDLILRELGCLHQGVVPVVLLIAPHPARTGTFFRNSLLVETSPSVSGVELHIRSVSWAGNRRQRFGADARLVELGRAVSHRR